MNTHPIVIFDLGGVLIDWNPRYLYRKLIAAEDEMEHFLSAICSPSWNEQQDRGRSFTDAIAELSHRHPAHAALIRAYHERWGEMLQGPIAGTVALLHALHRAGIQLHALTNWSAETFPIAQSRFPFLRLFGEIVVSGQERLIKPDPALFARLLDRINQPVERCLFIDDSPPNVATARVLGFDAVRFESPPQLRQALASRGLPLVGAEEVVHEVDRHRKDGG